MRTAATVTATITIMLINMRKLSKIFICVFAAASLVSCSKEPSGEPFMLFEIHGKVMDADGNPLEGIHVISGQADVQKTNINGVFTFFGRSVPSEHALLTFEDKDGEENGGEFVKKTMEIPLVEKTPGSGNIMGTFFAGDVEVVMLNKNMEMNPDSGLIPQGNRN